jgi:hypothetical protein
MVEKEDGHFLVGLCPNVDPAVDSIGGLVPVDLSRRDREALPLPLIAVVEGQGITAQHDRDPRERIAMPGHGPAGC